jgi:hypothetical protein
MGQFSWDPRTISFENDEIMSQLLQDLCRLRAVLQGEGGPVNWSQTTFTPEMQNWFKKISEVKLEKVLSFKSEIEDGYKARRQPRPERTIPTQFECQACSLYFTSAMALQSHKNAKHHDRNPYRSQVKDQKCPGCSQTFNTRAIAQRHWQNQVCVRANQHQFTFEQLVAAEEESRNQADPSHEVQVVIDSILDDNPIRSPRSNTQPSQPRLQQSGIRRFFKPADPRASQA